MLCHIDSGRAAFGRNVGAALSGDVGHKGCALQERCLCAAFPRRDERMIPSYGRTVRARRTVYRAGDDLSGALVICRGWALRFVQFPNGKRQVLSIVLPGQLASPTLLLDRKLPFSIQAVTEVACAYIPFADIHDRFRSDPAWLDLWLGMAAADRRSADQQLINIGRRSAFGRIAALIAAICEILVRQSAIDENGVFEFPLTQRQIADAAALTPVHTCRIVRQLRAANICDIGNGKVRIIDFARLQDAASA